MSFEKLSKSSTVKLRYSNSDNIDLCRYLASIIFGIIKPVMVERQNFDEARKTFLVMPDYVAK